MSEQEQIAQRPIFAAVLGSDWEQLPPVFHKHYANRPYTRDHVIVHGILNVESHGAMNVLKPFYRLLHIVPAVTEAQVPVTVHFESEPDSKAFRFNRQFHFQHHKPYHFLSRMIPLQGNRLVEMMGWGICWCLRYEWRDHKMLLQHEGYALHWFGRFIPIPLDWLIGRGTACETAVDEDHFDMVVNLDHPLFGHLYRYSGRFKVIKTA